jgi:putative ATP-binding cassette transporter
LLLAAVVGLTLGAVVVNVRLSTWNSDFYDALQNREMDAFWRQLGVFALLAAAFIVIAVYRLYLQQRLQMRWRVWLSTRLMAQWLRPGLAYRLGAGWHGASADAPQVPDNPDQRIAEDVQQFVDGCLTLSLGLLNATVTLVSFVGILWGLSGAWHVDVGGHALELPGFMVWVALAYAAIGSGLAHRIGRPLVSLGVQQQRMEADFRYALVQVRDHAEAIALARGEAAERDRLGERLASVRGNWWRLIMATKRLTWFTAGYSQVAVVFPLIAASPRYFSGQMALGGLMQTAQAFGAVQGALSWFVDAYASLADWRATVQRLAGFRRAMCDEAALLADVSRLPPTRPGLALEVEGLTVQAPGPRVLAEVRSEERRVGKECRRLCRSRWSPYH